MYETTLSGRNGIRFMNAARQAGHRVELHYICLEAPEQSLLRIRNRVKLGQHDIPEADVRRRFGRSLANLPEAITLADEIRLYDNSTYAPPHREITVFNSNELWVHRDLPPWAKKIVATFTQQICSKKPH